MYRNFCKMCPMSNDGSPMLLILSFSDNALEIKANITMLQVSTF